VVGYIAVGFFICYMFLEGGPKAAINKIAGEIYWSTMPSPIGSDIESSIEKTLENLRKKVDNF
jgi:hypothetical protein